MVKAYLRYEFVSAFGVISSNANPLYDPSGRFIITSSLENISIWNTKQGHLIKSLTPNGGGSASNPVAEVTTLSLSPLSFRIAAGYSDGSVRIWDAESGECLVTLKGHKSSVSALRYHPNGGLLASGGSDTHIVVWDVGAEEGVCKLKGHKDQVTDLVFAADANKLLSTSKDGFLRVWDLDTQHCSQLLGGQVGEIWSLDIHPDQNRIVTGSNGPDVAMYRVSDGSEQHSAPSETASFLLSMGSVPRRGTGRVGSVRFSPDGQLLVVAAAGKSVELFRVRSEEEAKKKMKRRKKRKREKLSKKQQGAEAVVDDGAEEEEDQVPSSSAADELEPFHVLISKQRVKGVAWAPLVRGQTRAKGASPAGAGHLGQLALSLGNNCIEVVSIDAEAGFKRSTLLERAGHQSDVRVVALSPDDSLLVSGSANSVKLWNPLSGACLGTIDSGYGLSAVFAPGGRHVALGTKEGSIEVFDIGSCERVHVEEAHRGSVWAMSPLPDRTGFVTGGADKMVKFWQWMVGADGKVGLVAGQSMAMTEDVLALKVSPNGRLLAVALLDATIKVFYTDSLRFFLSLYGHKLPVLCLDISSDNTLLVSGSADKNIKVWGLDFGDCHKSIFAHQDSVTSVQFVTNTHYAFTTGKDKMVKYWDLDRYELLLDLPSHHGEVWGLAISRNGDFIITCGHDRSIRRFERTTEPFFVEEEKEKRLESLFEADMEARDRSGATAIKEGDEGAEPAGRKTLETLGAADAIIDALDVAAHETERAATASAASTSAPPNPLLQGMSPSAYVLRAVQGVRSADLEVALMMLPFTDALKLMAYLTVWLQEGSQVELICRVASLLLRLHHSTLVSTPSCRPTLLALSEVMRPAVAALKDVLGTNLAALRHLQRAARERVGEAEGDRIAPARKRLGLK